MGVFWVFPRSRGEVMESWFLHNLNWRRRFAWITIPAAVLWTIWKEMNSRIFEGKTSKISELIQKTKWSRCVFGCVPARNLKTLKPMIFCILGRVV